MFPKVRYKKNKLSQMCNLIQEYIKYYMMQYKINWRGHIPKQILNYKPEGRRNIGSHKRDGEMISERKEQAKRPNPYR